MADILTFDPTSEFEVLESFEFEEEVQRPEEIRFFTLDEQLLDFQAKMLSGKLNVDNMPASSICNSFYS